MVDIKENTIRQLYYEKKLSVAEMSKYLRINQWTLLKFMKKNNLPRRSFQESNKVQFAKKPLSFSPKKKLSCQEKKLKIAGLMLYWAEGFQVKPGRQNCTVDLANSNPAIIKIFLDFLRKICCVDNSRLRVFLYCYADQDIEKIKKFWHNLTKIPLSQFTKPYIKNNFRLEKSGKMKFGLIHIRYNDKKLLLRIDKWIKEFVREMGASDSSNSTSL